MISINKNIQSEILMTTMEEIVPEDSLFRKIDKYIDFTFIYDKVKELYCENNGRPSIDPVVLFKIVFIQTLDGIKSMRQTCKKIKVDAEYRWFLGIPFGQDTPHFSTFSKNYERRFKDSDIFEDIFVEIVNQAIKYNLIDGTTFYTDSTHKKANANKNKYDDEIVKVIKERRKWLEEEINEERIKQGRKPFEYKDETEEKHIKVSTTDKESGYYHRDNKEKGFMYLDHRTVDDKCNIIVDAYITKGNVHDSVPFIDRAEYIKNKFGLGKDEYILFLGRLVPEKGIKYLIEAFKQVDTEKKLVIAGGSSDTSEFENEMKELAKEDKRILFTGFVQGQELEELYSNAYVYVLPSDLEGMPLSLLEAMSYGNCCLVSDIPECVDVVEDKALIFQKSDVNSLYTKLVDICCNSSKVQSFKRTAEEFVCNKYSWNKIVKDTCCLYR